MKITIEFTKKNIEDINDVITYSSRSISKVVGVEEENIPLLEDETSMVRRFGFGEFRKIEDTVILDIKDGFIGKLAIFAKDYINIVISAVKMLTGKNMQSIAKDLEEEEDVNPLVHEDEEEEQVEE